ncbi:cobalamin biosynthesis protein [Streptomyces sp. TRM49041]|uniref:cobalamin biosynthesis protein n=1 Tax=Streptomyces sp. TRM49041 TaxID=2603216 RepID=UPI0037D9B2F4
MTLVVGVGARRGVTADEVCGLVEAVLAAAGLRLDEVAALATVDTKAAEPGLLAAAARLGVPLRAHPARDLARVAVPHPSDAALRATGTPSVAEAAALLEAALLEAAGPEERAGLAERAEPAVGTGLAGAAARAEGDALAEDSEPADLDGHAEAVRLVEGGAGVAGKVRLLVPKRKSGAGAAARVTCAVAVAHGPRRLPAGGPGYTRGDAAFELRARRPHR